MKRAFCWVVRRIQNNSWPVIILIVAGFISLFMGCGSSEKPPPKYPATLTEKGNLGDGWLVLEGPVGGKTRKFLFHSGTRTITEIKD